MRAAERQERDADVLRMFMAGSTYLQIARATGVSVSRADQIVKRELSAAATRRTLLTDEALAVYQERTERLFMAHWGPALKGDHRSADICRKMLDANARLHGLFADQLPALPAPTSTVGVNGDEDEEPADDLARIRARRTSAS